MKTFIILITAGLLSSCLAMKAKSKLGEEKTIAFAGAEGFGKYTSGGRNGKVYIVSNLEDDGEGSFRKAVVSNDPRIIVFAVSGTIHLKSKLNIKGDVTIAGQTAPGDGICVADYPVSLSGDNIIVRYLRFRMGDRFQNHGQVDGAGADDAFGASGRKNIMIDHCSMSWSTDEVCSIYKGDSTTLQWNLITEPLNYSYHFEEGDKDFEHHGYGGIWGGQHLTAHHNLIANCSSRNPRFNGARLGATTELVDFRNNVIYNWGHNSAYGGEGGLYNMIANYYKAGPNTKKEVKDRIVNPSYLRSVGFGSFYVADNEMEGFPEVTKNNALGIHPDKEFSEADRAKVYANKAFPSTALPDVSAKEAYQQVIKNVGAILPKRDTLDERVINDMLAGKGRVIDVQGGFPHGTAYEISKMAWPELKTALALTDTDKDGLPDDWEIKNGLNPKDKSDSNVFGLSKAYTNLEIYVNSLVK